MYETDSTETYVGYTCYCVKICFLSVFSCVCDERGKGWVWLATFLWWDLDDIDSKSVPLMKIC